MSRLHDLARQCWAAINLGHEPVESIRAALARAVDERAEIPPEIDGLPKLERSVCLALLGEDLGLKCQDVAGMLERKHRAVNLVLRRLRRRGLIERPAVGIYRLARTRSGRRREFTVREFAERHRLTRNAARHRLSNLARKGVIQRLRLGTYTATDQGTIP